MSDINGVMMQYFHWYIEANGSLWKEVRKRAGELAKSGITALWLPPAYKGCGGKFDVGYGVYDMYDLGEFDQKGSVATKYGTKKQYLAAVKKLHKKKIAVYADAVFNHRMGGDAAETVNAVPYNQNDRINPKSQTIQVKTYTSYTFPGRKDRYSSFKWNWYHFDAADYNDFNPNDKDSVFLFEGKTFDDYVALERGNYAYLMGCDVDFQNPEVRKELTEWTKWYLSMTDVDGFRLDALKHISSWFFPQWIDEIENHSRKKLFTVGEYWSSDIQTLHWYLDNTGGKMSVFDVPLHFNFHTAGKSGGNYDMRYILDGTLMRERPCNAVTFVENHDSQPLQSLESVVEPWFKPLAYAIILLRREGYPCIFYADYYGAEYEDYGHDGNRYKITMPSYRKIIDIFLDARRKYAYGPQLDYFDHWNIIGWTRTGDNSHFSAMAVVMSDGPGGGKWMDVCRKNSEFTDITGNVTVKVKTNEYGWGEFFCNGGSVSVWVQE